MSKADQSGGNPAATASHGAVKDHGFGMFGGVFTPSILTILGVIMYLRFGEVVGNTGLGQAWLIVIVAHLITLATGLSISAIATNRTVRAGGAYYIISRSLGAPAGAAIGVPLFLAQAISITFYIVGFTESLRPILPPEVQFMPDWALSSIVLWLLALVTYKSADLAIKAQYVVMGFIGISLISFFTGTAPDQPESITWWRTTDEGGVGFGPMFALFFPAVTGIMAGVGMSGDLKNPRRALPLGTLLAVGCGFIVYMAFPVWLAYNASPEQMVAETGTIVATISSIPAAFYAGVWGATLSSALGSFLTAPRTLQALAFDKLVPQIFARGSGPTNEPRVGIVFTLILAQIGVLLGDLSAIAPLLTMFFLATYGFTNLASGLEKWASSPSFRPTFAVPAWISLAGGAGCFYVMSIINLPAMIASFVLCSLIYIGVQRRNMEATWGDARHGIWSALVQTALNQLRRAEFHPSNWRPNLLILGGGGKKRLHLLELGSAIVQDRGIVTYMYLLRGKVAKLAADRNRVRDELDRALQNRFPNVFCRVDIVNDLYRGVVAVAQSYGVGSFETNTIMLGWPTNADKQQRYLQMLRDLAILDRSLLLVHYDRERKLGAARKIQIWWGGLQHNGGLMLLLAFLITAHVRWRKASVEIVTVVNTKEEQVNVRNTISKVIVSAHLEAQPCVILREDRSVRDIMEAQSKHVDLAIVGMRLPPPDEPAKDFFDRMNALLSALPTTLLVHSARNFQGDPVLFDEDDQGGGEPPKPKPEPEPDAPSVSSGGVSAAESMTGLLPDLSDDASGIHSMYTDGSGTFALPVVPDQEDSGEKPIPPVGES